MALFSEGLALAGILLVLVGLVQTGRMFREEYHGPLPAMVQGFSPIITGGQAGSAPPLATRPVTTTRPVPALVSPAERQQRQSAAAGSRLALLPTSPAGAAPPAAGAAQPPAGEVTQAASEALPPAGNATPPAGNATPPAGEAAPQVFSPTQAAGQLTEAQPAPTATELPAAPDWIDIPVIGLEAPVVTVEAEPVRVSGLNLQQWSAPNQFAAGWHSSSALLGQPGNTVLNGHHNIHGSVFARLRDLQTGDQVFVWAQGRTFFYEVEQVLLLEERFAGLSGRTENARWILPSEDERLTLVTCWPPESNTHRLIVVARPIP